MDPTRRLRSWFLVFLLLNTLKVALAEVALQASIGPWLLLYKFCFLLLPQVAFFLVLLTLGSRLLLASSYALQAIYLLAQVAYFDSQGSYLHALDLALRPGEGLSLLIDLIAYLDRRSLLMLLDLPAFAIVLGSVDALEPSRGFVRPLFLGAALSFFLAVAVNEGWSHANGESLARLRASGKALEPIIVERYGILVNDVVHRLLPPTPPVP